jgi:5-methyltetrahydropteroyltriglutamate--homocysteine methyltransferase
MAKPNRILTTHAGSLPRPAGLISMFTDRVSGKPLDEAAFNDAIENATRWVIERQRDAGIDIPNNGEQGRESFFLYVRRRMTGFGGHGARKPWADLLDFPEFAEMSGQYFANKKMVSNRQPPLAQGPVKHIAPEENLAEINQFKAALEDIDGGFADAFMTAPSPGMVASAMHNRYYPDDDAYLDALSDALSVEYRAAVESGLILQIDAPDLAMERHISHADQPLDAFLDFMRRVITRINRALDGVPRERVRLHVCWGNYEGPHTHDVALREILPVLLEANVGAFMMPFANPRHQHEIDVFRDLPLAPDQYLIAGVVDTLTNFVEHPEVVARRIEQAVEAVGDASRVLAGTDCGFDTSAGMGRVSSDVVWAKLRAMRDGADIAGKRLF